jgi:hypothetical protein
VGCLCKLDPDYSRSMVNTLRWEHGFAFGVILPNGTYQCWQARSVRGQWVIPSDISVYAKAS